MPASLSPKFSQDQIRAARARILLDGHDTVQSWAKANGFSVTLVHNVLTGTRRCLRGKSADVATRLGLAPANDHQVRSTPKHAFTGCDHHPAS